MLHEKHTQIRIWLSGLYQAADRDPEGSYLGALAWNQIDQRFSSLWRRLVLDEEMPGRSYRDIGLLGFRKMPDSEGHPASDVPEGLLRAIVDLADQPTITEDEWSRTVQAIFAVYRDSEGYWISRFKNSLEPPTAPRRATEWLSHLLPHWQQPPSVPWAWNASEAKPVSVTESKSWVSRLRYDPSLCNSPELEHFLDRHRAHTRATGDSHSLVITFNSISKNVSAAKPLWAVDLAKEALDWEPYNHRTWTVYAEALWQADKHDEALDILWQARQRFPWEPFIRNELGRLLREKGDMETSKAVYWETSMHIPGDIFSRCALAELLIQVNELNEAERIIEEARQINNEDHVIRNQLAEVWFIKSAQANDTSLRECAKELLRESGKALHPYALQVLSNFDRQWNLAVQKGGARFFEREIGARQVPEKNVAEMRPAERLGRAMIALQQAEKATSNDERNQRCDWADRLLDIPEAVAAKLLTALVETRGFVLLARRDAVAAHHYFINQIEQHGRGSWIGVRLGLEHARTLLGDASVNLLDFDSQSARFALQVAQVIRLLFANADERRVADLLCEIYPLATSFAGNERGIADHASRMVSEFLNVKWFRPAGVRSAADLADPDHNRELRRRIRETSSETFNVLESTAMAA